MAYKSILTFWDGQDNSLPALNAAIDITRQNDGHLSVYCIGFTRLQPGLYFSEATSLVVNDDHQFAVEAAQEQKASAQKILEKTNINWICQTAVTPLNSLSGIIKSAAWFSDLVILPQPYGHENTSACVAVTEAALFESSAPVLVYPLAPAPAIGKRIVIAWNESFECLQAIRASLPYLITADTVDIAIIDPKLHDPSHADPGSDLSKFLSRHGVKVSVSVLPRTVPRVSDVIRQHATDLGADLIVMGAYGHSRLRESLLGGATRHMLEEVEIPVIMAR